MRLKTSGQVSRVPPRNNPAARVPLCKPLTDPGHEKVSTAAILVETHDLLRSVHGNASQVGRHAWDMHGTPGLRLKQSSPSSQSRDVSFRLPLREGLRGFGCLRKGNPKPLQTTQ